MNWNGLFLPVTRNEVDQSGLVYPSPKFPVPEAGEEVLALLVNHRLGLYIFQRCSEVQRYKKGDKIKRTTVLAVKRASNRVDGPW